MDVRASQQDDEYQADWKRSLFIGLAQAAAMIPGTSRSGATMTAALYLGFTREAAARFSFPDVYPYHPACRWLPEHEDGGEWCTDPA